jgi:hypothetical protein
LENKSVPAYLMLLVENIDDFSGIFDNRINSILDLYPQTVAIDVADIAEAQQLLVEMITFPIIQLFLPARRQWLATLDFLLPARW